jgi:hypothetical protein
MTDNYLLTLPGQRQGAGYPPAAESAPEPTAADKLRALSAQAVKSAAECLERGDTEGSFYARGLRDAYANAALFAGEK